MTTNSGAFMAEALKSQDGVEPRREGPRWEPQAGTPQYLLEPPPSVDQPVVFHLNGFDGEPEQECHLVLSEDDYFAHLVRLARDQDRCLPTELIRALSGNSFLFLGYRLDDWDFRLLLHGLLKPIERHGRRSTSPSSWSTRTPSPRPRSGTFNVTSRPSTSTSTGDRRGSSWPSSTSAGARWLDRCHEPLSGHSRVGSEDRERFFGRREETDILAALVLARRATLLFAQSGAGKSSLIQAGLIPELGRAEEMTVLPVTGVGGRIPRRFGRLPDNLYAFSALYGLFPEAEPGTLVEQRLTEGIAPLVEEASKDDRPVLLVIDQFEELFTHHPERWHQRLPFFEQVAEALEKHRDLHLLLSMREDFIAELTPFAALLPGGLRDRFRLERLRPGPALDAVREPAERAGIPFAAGVAEELVDNLRRAQAGPSREAVAKTTIDGEIDSNECVEPVHLQIVCQRLWQNLGENQVSIERGDLQQFGDVDQALKVFYTDSLQRALETTTVPEHRLRGWFEDTTLITPVRTRGLVYRGETDTAGIPNAVVGKLVDTYLIRATRRGSDTWYELAHDRLVEPILADNREWRAEHLKPLTVTAEAWTEADKDPRKLYSGVLLAEARAATRTNPDVYSKLELAFLEASVRAQRRRFLTLVGIAALLCTAVFFYLRQRSERKLRTTHELIAESAAQLQKDPEQSLQSALKAVERLRNGESEHALRRALLEPWVLAEWAEEGKSEVLSGEQTSPGGCSSKEVLKLPGFSSVALSPGGRHIAAGDFGGSLRLARAGAELRRRDSARPSTRGERSQRPGE